MENTSTPFFDQIIDQIFCSFLRENKNVRNPQSITDILSLKRYISLYLLKNWS